MKGMLNMKNLRAPAVPLINVDPYFNIWSFADRLTDDPPRHWTGRRNPMTGLLRVDGEWLRFMGRIAPDDLDCRHEPEVMEQISVTVDPTVTRYVFEGAGVRLRLQFLTPLLLDDLMLMSRPVSYVFYEISSIDGKEHDVVFYFDISAEASVDHPHQSVRFGTTAHGVFCGRGDQDVLGRSGDDLRIEWGWLHLFSGDHLAAFMNADTRKRMVRFYRPEDVVYAPEGEVPVEGTWPCLALRNDYRIAPEHPVENFLCIGYDDLYSIEYFHQKLKGYWAKDGDTFEDVYRRALTEFPAILDRCRKFDGELKARAEKISENYRDILSLAYRQAIAAHKLVWDGNEILFLSKECFSNGCIGTVDVTYPSIPLFLLFNPDLVCGMLNPIFRFAASGDWPYPYAPHDVGQYPLANRQVYGYREKDFAAGTVEDKQMPVEECGNMLLCVAAVCEAKHDTSYAKEHEAILQQWVDYLIGYGLDPENQLCTDDFAGHLAHNANLSVKAIMGIAAWGMLCGRMGKSEAEKKYTDLARSLAAQWKERAYDPETGVYRLAFDQPGTWSIKYNLVWDKLFDLHIFDGDVFETEVNSYLSRINRYGLPLDCRSDYTKSDWQMWSTVLTENKEYETVIIDAMWKMLNETKDRAPFTDWYYTTSGYERGFQNRTVQGGLFINLLRGQNHD